MTPAEWDRLVELDVVGAPELTSGQVRAGRFPLSFSREAVEAAREAGIELDPRRLDPPPS